MFNDLFLLTEHRIRRWRYDNEQKQMPFLPEGAGCLVGEASSEHVIKKIKM